MRIAWKYLNTAKDSWLWLERPWTSAQRRIPFRCKRISAKGARLSSSFLRRRVVSEPAALALTGGEDLRLEAAALRVPAQHAEDVAGPQRRFVPSDALPHLHDDVLGVGGVALDEGRLQLLLEPVDLGLQAGGERGKLRVVPRVDEIGARALPRDGKLVRRLQLLEPAPDVRGLTVVVVHGRVGQPRLQVGVRALELVDEWFDSGHAEKIAWLMAGLAAPPPGGSQAGGRPALAGRGNEAASSVISGTPASAFETGQPTFAPSAAATKAASSIPGTLPRTVTAILVMPVPGTNVTVEDVSSWSAGVPARASASESAIEKQAECAAAMSSSGLVFPSGSSAREAHVTSRGPNAPLPASWIVPEPSIRVPRQVVLIVRSVAIVGRLLVVGVSLLLLRERCRDGHRRARADQRRQRAAGVRRLGRLREGRVVAVRDGAVRFDLRVHDLMSLAFDLVHRDHAATSRRAGGVPRSSARSRATS